MKKGAEKIIKGLLMIITFFLIALAGCMFLGIYPYLESVSRLLHSMFSVILYGGIYGVVLGSFQVIQTIIKERQA